MLLRSLILPLFAIALFAGVGMANPAHALFTCDGGFPLSPIGGCEPPPIDDGSRPIVTLTATPATITQGNSTRLSWNPAGATSCSIDQGIGSVSATGGYVDVTPSSSLTYTITCSNYLGSASDGEAVTVNPAPPQPVVVSLSVKPASVVQGQSSTLSWSSTNATSCTGTNFSTGGATSGTLSVSPSATTNYAVSCANAAGTVSAYATLTVIPTLAASCSVSPASITTGQSVTWTSSVSGGTGSYSYAWWGTDSLSGNSSSVAKIYGATGNKTGNFSVSSGSQTVSVTCANSVSVGMAPAPNLTASIGPAVSATAGTSATFTGSTYNNGNASTGASFTDLFVFYTADQSTWQGYQYAPASGALAAGANVGRSVSYSFPTAGTYYYRLCADWNGNVAEANEGDNCSALQTVTVTAPPPPIPPQPTGLTQSCNATGDQVTLSWNTAPGAANYYVRLYDGITSPSGYGGYNDLYAGTSISYPVVPGRYYDWWVHSNNATGYSGATYGSFTCAGLADLTAGSVSPGSATVGTPVTFSAVASNIASGASGSFPLLFQLQTLSVADSGERAHLFARYLGMAVAHAARFDDSDGGGGGGGGGGGSQPSTPSSDILFNSGYIGGLAQGASGTASAAYTFSKAGTYQIRACANYNTAWTAITTESNYGNNCGPWTTVTVASNVLSCSVNPTSLNQGGSATYTVSGGSAPYTWTASDGTSMGTGSSVSRSFPNSGPYGMTVAKSGYTSANCPFVSSVATTCSGAPTMDIAAAPNRVRAGQTSTITWSASNVPGESPSCTVSGPGLSQTIPASAAPSCVIPNGSAAPVINTQSTYTITCGGTSKSVTVNVIPQFQEF